VAVGKQSTAAFFQACARQRLFGHNHAMPIVNGKPSMHAQAPSTPAVQAGVPAVVQQAVQSTGIALPGQPPADAAKQLLGTLNSQGFQAPAAASKDFGTQLGAALKAFQGAQGLPQTGKLDGQTAEALKNLGLAGAPREPAVTEKATRDNFERGGLGLLKQGEKGRADIAKNSTPDTNFLDALINKLGGDKGVTSDRAGLVGGSAESATNMSKADSSVDAKKASETDKSGAADAKKASKEDAAQSNLDKIVKDNKLQVARGLKADQTKTEEQRRKAALTGKDPTERGILDEEADDDATEGDGGDGGKRGKGGDQSGGGQDASGTDSAGDSGERDGDEKTRGNAHSGDDDHGDERRGHASLDDGTDADAGHYRVPSLSEQAFAALDKIKRDQTASNKATTYTWDVMFFVPGIYSPGQKAQDLVHLVVKEATAFDAVWQRAQANLQVMVRRLERDGAVPTLDDIVAALRQARARDGSPGADKVTFRRPPGRA
jgi:hypothetical protein